MLVYLNMGGYELMLIIVVLSLLFLIPLLALIDILKSNFEPVTKLTWVLIVIFLSFLGALLYFVIGRQQKNSESNI